MKAKLKIHIGGVLRILLIFACIAILWWYFRTYELFIMMVLAVCMPLLSVFVLLRKWEAFDVRVELPGTGIGKNTSVPLTIQVRNACHVAGFAVELVYEVRNCFTEYSDQNRIRIWAAPGNSAALEKELKSQHLGRIEVKVTEYAVRDWLGICSMNKTLGKGSWVVAGPVKADAPGEDLTISVENFPNENETKKHGIDLNPDYEIREYVPGDDLKNIHWKLTAKTGRTMVRERLSTGREKINVLLALTQDPDENDALVASLQGLGELLLDKGYPIRLCWLGHMDALKAHYLAEEGELEKAMEEILSTGGIKNPDKARTAMETEYQNEAYILVKNGAFKGAYIRQNA